MGNLSRSYERYKFKRFEVMYAPERPTSTLGTVVITSSKSFKEPFINTGSNFLNRAMTQGNSVIGPIWQPLGLSINCDDVWRVTDPLIDGDMDDAVAEEVQVYTTAEVAARAGYLIVDYELHFQDPVFQPHSVYLPISTGPTTQYIFTDDGAVNATTDAVLLTNTTLAGISSSGDIFRCVFQSVPSTPPTGPANFAAMWSVAYQSATTTTTTSTTTATIAAVEGTTLYLLNRNDTFIAYGSLEAATVGGINGSLTYQTATTVAGLYYFLTVLVRIPTGTILTTQ